MTALWLDAFAGISGDMFLGALLDLGVPLAGLNQDLAALHLPGLKLTRKRVRRGALTATQAVVKSPGSQQVHVHRDLKSILRIISRAAMPPAVRQQAQAVFQRLGTVEARLHGVPVEKIHFHELGAWDTIADIVGTCAGLQRLGIGQVWVGPVNVGSGWVRTEHGLLPVPAPATLELLAGFDTISAGPAAEHTTPTGAALLAVLAQPAPTDVPLRLTAVGYGAGERQWPDFPNLLRARLLAPAARAVPWEEETIAVLSANLDDTVPQVLGYVVDALLAAGALDASLQPLQMKKNRPGVRVEVLCRPEQASGLAKLLFTETTTLGVRIGHQRRLVLPRRSSHVDVLGHRVRVKLGYLSSRRITVLPEYEDVKACARSTGRPLREILETAREKAKEQA